MFWQIDISGRCRIGKIMLCDSETGHKVKNPVSKMMWVHMLHMFKDFCLRQCLFGEHQLAESGRVVAIVESEKTAIIASMFFPDAIWLATGCLKGRRIFLFHDLGVEEFV